jgi:NAD(P)H-hydrate epimerase
MLLYSASAMREIDRKAIEGMGIPSLRLMENAGQAVVCALFNHAREGLAGRAVILCGKGNNGGDGMVVARILRRMGFDPLVLLLARPDSLSGDAAVQFARLSSSSVRVRIIDLEACPPDPGSLLKGAELLVDAILGTGTQGAVSGYLAEVIAAANASPAFVAAVDIPSGLSGDALAPVGPCIRADLTVTLAHPKPCIFTPEGAPHCGKVEVADIGIPPAAAHGQPVAGEAVDGGWAAPFFNERPSQTHKGSCGRVLLIAGSRGKAGAAVLAARGALRAGAGLVTVAVPTSAHAAVAGSLPEAMTLPLPETREGTLSMDALAPILQAAGSVDAVGIGPGLGTVPETAALLRELFRDLPCPAVVDADALNALAGCGIPLRQHAVPRILTPHPGEMTRLDGRTTAEVIRDRYTRLASLAEAWDVVVHLKGFRSLTAAPGKPWRMNLSGGPHMAAPGMGDVLTGVAAALLARAMDPFDAASLAAWWHGAAADLAFQRLGGYGLLASEVADALPAIEGALRKSLSPFAQRPKD